MNLLVKAKLDANPTTDFVMSVGFQTGKYGFIGGGIGQIKPAVFGGETITQMFTWDSDNTRLQLSFDGVTTDVIPDLTIYDESGNGYPFTFSSGSYSVFSQAFCDYIRANVNKDINTRLSGVHV